MANGLENIKEEIVDQIDDLEQQVEDLDLENELEKNDDENDQNDTGVHEDDEEAELDENLAVNDEGLHPLERQWCMWFMNGSKPKNDSKKGGHQNNGWNQGLIELANFGTENQKKIQNVMCF